MEGTSGDRPTPAGLDGDDQRTRQLRRYTYVVTVGLILLCNGVLLLVVWASGVNLDRLIRTPDEFDPTKDVCLRSSWHKVAGLDDPIQLCSEWINLSDPSGETHKFQRETRVVQGADGRLYFDHGALVDDRLFLLAACLVLVVATGIALERYLIARYRLRLGLEPHRSQSSN